MTLSVLVLERPGRWRLTGLSIIIAISILPALPLFFALFEGNPLELSSGLKGFLPLLSKSLTISFSGAGIALILGLVQGVFYSLYQYKGRRLFLFLSLIPLMVPSLLWAVSYHNLASISSLFQLSKTTSYVFITAMVTFPLVVASTVSACSSLNSSQCEAIRLGSGEGRLFWLTIRFSFPSASIAACLGAFIMLSSPGPAMGLGVKTAISEVLISFSALYDPRLAALQCLMLSSITLVLALLLLSLSGKRPIELLASSSKGIFPYHDSQMSRLAFSFSLIIAFFLVILPCAGLIQPALARPDMTSLAQTIARTMPYTILYSMGSAIVALVIGLLMAFFMGRFHKTRLVGMSAILVIFSLPASLTALGFVYMAANAPEWMDFILRSPFAVCLSQGLRLFPVPTLLAARFFASLPSSWSYAAELQEVSLLKFSSRILLPLASSTILTSFLLVSLLSVADIATVLLIHPPGGQNLPLAIFTIMANAPQSQVSQLCSIYLLSAIIFLLVISTLWEKQRS